MFKYLHKYNTSNIFLALLFLWTPLIFSHVFSLIGISSMILPFGYERYKVYFFIGMLFLTGMWTCYKSTSSWKDKIGEGIIIFCIVGVGVLYWGYFLGNPLGNLLIGTPEKHHGLLFFLALLGLFAVLRKEHTKELQKLLVGSSLVAGVLISVYALLQYAGVDPVVVNYYHDGWDVNRVFASLGNPNYLAGYLLLLLPLLSQLPRLPSIGLWVLFSFVIMLTGSVTGIVLTAGYFIWMLVGKGKNAQKIFFVCSVLIIVGCILFFALPHEKILSIETRFSLWREALQIFYNNPLILPFGNGPDTILSYIQDHAIVLDPVYFAPSSIIDSFHNITIDSIFFFGLPLTISGYIYIIKRWKELSKQGREGIVLFFLFFSMNIPISVHFLLLILFIIF